MKYSIFIVMLSILFSCTHQSTQEEVSKFSNQFHNDEFDLRGNYNWEFQLMGSKQLSTHNFFADSITYSMEGKVYSTVYTMEKLSYDKSNNKWIGRDQHGVVYVLFFKDQTDSTVTIYKRKCKTNGIEEAVNFGTPEANATDDHGWNVYAFNQADTQDILPVNGNYADGKDQVQLTDSLVVFRGQKFSKLSYHHGERRWVGQGDTTFLQVFLEDVSNPNLLKLSFVEYNDLEKAYKTKFNTANFLAYEKE